MLWHKAWLETRWRFTAGLIILTLGAGSTIYGYIATQRLMPTIDPSALSSEMQGPLAGVIREAIEIQKDFRGFIWYQAFRVNLLQMVFFFAVLLGCGGLLSEGRKGSALFTLSLPVTRKELVGARAATGLAQCFAIAMIPPLIIPLMAPIVGQRFSVVDALAHGLCLFFVAAVFYSLASFLSTLFADIWRPLVLCFVVGCAAAILQVIVPDLGIFRVMSGETYFRTGSLPWVGFLTSAVLATALLYSAAETLERRDF
jgi:ABC-type transport system involved in multi-copper enzyme maturation permease subunit